MKETKMKSINKLPHSIFLGCIVLGTFGVLSPSLTLADGKGSSKLLFPEAAPAKVQSVPAKASAMACPRCLDVYTKVVDTSVKGMRAERLRMVPAHACPSCQTKITSIGVGKAKTDKVAHTCGTTAGAQASCCMAAK